MKIQNLINTAEQNNFQDYLDCPHPDRIEYPNINSFMMTCAEGLYSGEVIDALYNYKTGEVISLSVYSQFKGVNAKFSF